MSRAGIPAMGIGKMWTGKGKRVWMKSEEEDEDKGRTRGGPRGGCAADSRPTVRVGVTVSGARARTGVMWMWGELAYAESQPRLFVVLSDPLLFPAVVFQHLPHFYASDRGVGRGVGGLCSAWGCGKPARAPIGPRHLRLRPLPLPYALHASIAGATRTPPRARPRVNREVPGRINAHKRGVQDEVGGCPLLAHLCWRRYPQAYSTVPAARGPFPLLLAVGTPANRRAAETARARFRIATPSSGPDSAVQRIPDAVVAHLPIPAPTKTDDTSGRKPTRIGTHFDGAEAWRLSGSGRRGKRSHEWRTPRRGDTGGRGGYVDAELQGERSTVGGGWDDTNRRTDTSTRGAGVSRGDARHTASVFVSGDSEGEHQGTCGTAGCVGGGQNWA
ncbi:hypothetical protein B0H14DRAFT_3153710 [Mycena olivaceomarginata]|nr:hypothetical protein B0H14DRAFT_3153710 [Mycena olivaceomarginata]